jgi:hypothetical protein
LFSQRFLNFQTQNYYCGMLGSLKYIKKIFF